MEPNQTRAFRCNAALVAYGDDLMESNLVDFLADAMHWCDQHHEDFHYRLAQACRHYINELNDEQLDERRL
jgi:hypothetical protein